MKSSRKFLILDLGNVIVNVNESTLPFDYFSTNQDWHDFETGKLSGKQFFSKYPQYEKSFNEIFTLNEPVINLINSLENKSNVYYFSNTNPVHFEFLRTVCPLLNNNNNLFLSYEVGLRKPDYRFYSFIQRDSLSTIGPDIYFVDDRLENIEMAKNYRWHTFHYKYNNQEFTEFFEEIKNLL